MKKADKGKSFSWDSRMGGRVEHGSMYENEAKREAKKRKEKGLPPKKKKKTEYEHYLEKGDSVFKESAEKTRFLKKERGKEKKKPVEGMLESQGYWKQQRGGQKRGQQQKGGLGGSRSRKQNSRKATGSNPYA